MTKPTTTNQQKSIGPTQFANGDSVIGQIQRAIAQPKIRDLNDPEPKITNALKYVFGLIGLKSENLPNTEQKMILIDFIKRKFPTITPDEIVVAFQFMVSGELELVEHYQNFNAIYFSQVINNYKKRRIEVLPNREQPVQIEMSMKDRKQIRIDYINECIRKPYQYFKKTGNLTFGITPIQFIYQFLNDDLHVLKIAPEDKKDIYKKAVEVYRAEWLKKSGIDNFGKYRQKRNQIEVEGFESVFSFEIRNECFRICVHDYFRTTTDDFEKLLDQQIEKINQND